MPQVLRAHAQPPSTGMLIPGWQSSHWKSTARYGTMARLAPSPVGLHVSGAGVAHPEEWQARMVSQASTLVEAAKSVPRACSMDLRCLCPV